MRTDENRDTRIAVIQHGDYREALDVIGSGKSEPYFGMKYSLETLSRLLSSAPHLVVSLNAPRYATKRGLGRLVGTAFPQWPKWVPGSLAMLVWSRSIVCELKRFRPTHVLLRSGAPVLGTCVLRYCASRGLSTLVILANVMREPRRLWDRLWEPQFIRLLNGPNVFLVGNHKRPATQSMIDCGVSEDKAVAWDWPGLRHPRDYVAKRLMPGSIASVLYVGAMKEEKGVGDLIDAIAFLQQTGRDIRFTALGDGPDFGRMRARAARCRNVAMPGRVGNDYAFECMLRSTLVCVPSWHEFSEGMPLTLTEALASRTPVIASDHHVFTRAFLDGEGVVFFRARRPESIVQTICRVIDTPGLYEQLSTTTLDAFSRVECVTLFGDIIAEWSRAC